MPLTDAQSKIIAQIEALRSGLKDRLKADAQDALRRKHSLEQFIRDNQADYDAIYAGTDAETVMNGQTATLDSAVDSLVTGGMIDQTRAEMEADIGGGNQPP